MMQNKKAVYPGMINASRSRRENGSVQTGWVFDLDGVLHTKRVQETQLLEVLAECLAKGEPVTFNTGRSPEQVEEHILRPLAHLVKDERLLQRVMLVGEKGGAWASYTPDGELHVSYDLRFSVPLLFLATVSDLVQFSDLTHLLEIEQGKKTMLTLAMREGVSFEAFQKIQGHVASLLQQCLICYGLEATWKVDVNGNAIEVEHRQAGKGLGAQRIITWLRAQHIYPARMVAFGDSISDLAMAEELSTSFPIEFIFVGSSDITEAAYTFPIIRTQSRYELGTIEYLSRAVPSLLSLKKVKHA
jgi:hypothetical protein